MEVRKARYISGIRTVAELREARRELELREWFARERLEDDILNTFTLDTLLSIIAPPGSVIDRVIGGVETGFAAAQGIIGVIGSFFGGRARSKPAARTVRPRSAARATPAVRTAPAVSAASTTRTASAARAKSSAGTTRATTGRSVSRRRKPEIEVEVELETPKAPRAKR